jgi:hypothetical protein
MQGFGGMPAGMWYISVKAKILLVASVPERRVLIEGTLAVPTTSLH